jgi:hypothetical protein
MQSDGMVVAPGAYDGLTAKLIAEADFSAVYMTGAADWDPRREIYRKAPPQAAE